MLESMGFTDLNGIKARDRMPPGDGDWLEDVRDGRVGEPSPLVGSDLQYAMLVYH